MSGRYPNLRRILAPLFIFVYFLWFAGPGVNTYFSGDDLMNLHAAWSAPLPELVRSNLLVFTPYSRPLGAAFYRLLYHFFGFDPLPFRLGVFVFLRKRLSKPTCSRAAASDELELWMNKRK